MRFVLFILSIITLFIGLLVIATGKSAIHEIEGLILILISTVFITGATIADEVHAVRKEVAGLKNSEYTV